MGHGHLVLGLTLQLDGFTSGRAVVTPVEAARLVDSLYLLGGPHHHPEGDKEHRSLECGHSRRRKTNTVRFHLLVHEESKDQHTHKQNRLGCSGQTEGCQLGGARGLGERG